MLSQNTDAVYTDGATQNENTKIKQLQMEERGIKKAVAVITREVLEKLS